MSEIESTEVELSEEIRRRAVNFCRQENVSQADLAKMAGVSSSTLTEVLGDKYAGNALQTLRRVDAAIDAAESRKQAPAKGEFVMTAVAEEIFAVLKAIVRIDSIGVIHGPSGIGKTLTLRACLAMDFPQAIYLAITDECKSPTRLYARLVATLSRRGTSAPTGSIASAAFGWLVKRLSGSHRLILLDEAENLTMAALNGVRQLHDQTGCPVILTGRPPLMTRVKASMGDARIGGSLVGRISIIRDLLARTRSLRPGDGGARPLFSQAEIVEILAKKKIRLSRDGRKWLAGVANIIALGDHEGCGLRYAIQCATLCAASNPGERELTAALLQETNALQLGEEYAQAIESEVETYSAQAG